MMKIAPLPLFSRLYHHMVIHHAGRQAAEHHLVNNIPDTLVADTLRTCFFSYLLLFSLFLASIAVFFFLLQRKGKIFVVINYISQKGQSSIVFNIGVLKGSIKFYFRRVIMLGFSTNY